MIKNRRNVFNVRLDSTSTKTAYAMLSPHSARLGTIQLDYAHLAYKDILYQAESVTSNSKILFLKAVLLTTLKLMYVKVVKLTIVSTKIIFVSKNLKIVRLVSIKVNVQSVLMDINFRMVNVFKILIQDAFSTREMHVFNVNRIPFCLMEYALLMNN